MDFLLHFGSKCVQGDVGRGQKSPNFRVHLMDGPKSFSLLGPHNLFADIYAVATLLIFHLRPHGEGYRCDVVGDLVGTVFIGLSEPYHLCH